MNESTVNICRNCNYFFSLGSNNFACSKVVNKKFAMVECMDKDHKYFTKYAIDGRGVNLFTDIFRIKAEEMTI